MTEEERHAAAMADPDARPMTDEEWARARRVPRVRTVRRAFKLSQEDFAARFGIPLETIKAWELRHSEPDALAKAYLKVIAYAPDVVKEALAFKPGIDPRPIR